jgi:hypothetical protein
VPVLVPPPLCDYDNSGYNGLPLTRFDTASFCQRPLDSNERTVIANLRLSYTRHVFNDLADGNRCAQIQTWIDEALQTQDFGIGKNNDGDGHLGEAQTGLQLAHIDPVYMKRMMDDPTPANMRDLYSVFMHEVIHAWGGKSHPASEYHGAYTVPWFNQANATNLNDPSCID